MQYRIPFTELKIWQEGHDLALAVYRATANFPPDERFGLVSQFRRAAVSVTNNVAEGSGRRSLNDIRHFLAMARGSAQEVLNLTLLARDLGYIRADDAERLLRRYNGLTAGITSFMRKKTRP